MRNLHLFAILTALLFALPARAGDMATINVLGFSEDGDIFAFEEYGVQDGSGFPYANRYYIDTTSDTFLPGTPIKVQLQDGQATVDAARLQAENQSQSVVSDEALINGFRAGWNAVTELSADPHRMLVNPRPVVPPLDETLEFRLEELALHYPENCRDLGERIFGFRLLRIGTFAGERTRLVHEDNSIPVQPRLPARLPHYGHRDIPPAERTGRLRCHRRHSPLRIRGAGPSLHRCGGAVVSFALACVDLSPPSGTTHPVFHEEQAEA